MTRPDYVIVGPDPRRTDIANPGGQLTATAGLLKHAEERGLNLVFIDTLQGSFPLPPVHARVGKAVRRQFQFLWYSTFRRPTKGAIIFSAGPGSFMERSMTGLVARLFHVPAVLCLRSGRLIPFLGAKSPAGRIISTLVRLQPRILVQGRNWLVVLDRARVDRNRVKVVANWISPERTIAQTPRSARPDQPIHFIFVGWLVAEKGLRELLQASRTLFTAGYRFHLTIVGGGTLQNELAAEIKQCGLSKVISLVGWVEPKEVNGYLSNADVFVLPTYFEGFPNALIEALAMGLPAIATPVGAIPDSLEDQNNGFLVPPRDVAGLASAMKAYICNPDLVARHSVNAIETVRKKHDFNTNCADLFAAVTDNARS